MYDRREVGKFSPGQLLSSHAKNAATTMDRKKKKVFP